MGEIVVYVSDPLSVNRPLTSVARIVNVKVPAVPLIVPEINPELDKDVPVGSVPEARV
jgi:hypothetical protein